jgi:glycosyltransferase involved in cell wall biosynthesis
MRIALLSFDFGEYCVRLATALAQEAQVLLILPRSEAEPYISQLGKTVDLQTFVKPRYRQPLRQARMSSGIFRSIRQFDPDVLHLQQGHLWFNFTLPLLRRYPLVLTVHDPQHHLGDDGARKTPQFVMNYGFRRAAHIIVHAQQMKNAVMSVCHISGETIHVIPHVVLGDDTAHNQIQEQDHLVLFFGRIWEYKGLEYLIRAEPLITAQVPDAKIVIAGQGEDFVRYRRLMTHPDRFSIYNYYVSDEKRAEFFRQASVVVLPYVEASQSGVIPLAYTFSKPVVATTVGGLPEMVDEGKTGYLVPPRDENSLAEAVVRLLQNRELRHRLGANGRQKINTECSADTVARQTAAVYHRALGQDRC